MTEPAKNVVLITVDSLRADAVGVCGGRAATPAIDALGREGVVFERAFATGPHTTQSFPGILGSNYPTTGGSVQDFGARVSVAECFRAAGFRTAAFHSNPLLSRARGYDRGFETFWDSLPAPSGAARPPRLVDRFSAFAARRLPPLFRLARWSYRALGRRVRRLELAHEPAEGINARAVEWLSRPREPFFLWLHYMDPHWPYATRLADIGEAERAEARRLSDGALRRPDRLTGGDLARLREFYLREVRCVDDALGRLFAFLQGCGLWDKTAIALTGDHGEAFMEHGVCLHGDLLYDDLIRVPLVVRAPGREHAVRRDVVSLVDLAPTLCQLAGVAPSATFEGRPMLDAPPREAAFAETAYRLFVSETPRRVAVRTAEWKLIRDSERESEELYHVASDPGEAEPVSNGGQALPRLRQLLAEHLGRQRPQFERRTAARPLSEAEQEAVKARLRALGYLDELEE